jgi:hypothetical protein
MNMNKDMQMELQSQLSIVPNLKNGQSLEMNSC